MALEIIEKNPGEKSFILAGIRGSGEVVARNVQKYLGDTNGIQTKFITISIDKRNPGEVELSETMDFNEKLIIVIDDVANSGRTLLYALKPFLSFHPKKIQTLVLVERSHNSFPIHSDYIGLSVATRPEEHIYVEVDGDRIIGAYLE